MLYGIGMNLSGNVILTVDLKMSPPFTEWTLKLLSKHLNHRVPSKQAVCGTTRIVNWTKLVITGMSARNSIEMTRDKADLLLSLKNNATFSGWIPKILLRPKWLGENPTAVMRPSLLIRFEDPEGKIKERILTQKSLFVDFSHVTVKEYVPQPTVRQCLKCYNFGHPAYTCRRDGVCPYCSSD